MKRSCPMHLALTQTIAIACAQKMFLFLMMCTELQPTTAPRARIHPKMFLLFHHPPSERKVRFPAMLTTQWSQQRPLTEIAYGL